MVPFYAGQRLTAGVLNLIPRGIIGGREITGTGNLGAAITTVETMPTNMNSGTVNLEPRRRYKVRARYKMSGTVATDVWVIRIREGVSAGTTGTQIRQDVRDTVATSFGFTWELSADYETGSSAVSRVFSLTAVRAGGSGSLQFVGGDTGSTNPVGVWVYDDGPAGLLTVTAS